MCWASFAAGRRPEIESTFARGAEGIDDLNAANSERTAAQSLDEIKTRSMQARAAVSGAIGGMSDDEWNTKVPYESDRRRTTALVLASILGAPKLGFRHAFAHIPDLESYVAACSPTATEERAGLTPSPRREHRQRIDRARG